MIVELGHTALERRVAEEHRRLLQRRRVGVLGGQICLAVLMLLVWQLASGRWLDPFFISSPLEILRAAWKQMVSHTVFVQAQYTLVEVVGGYLLGAALALALALALTLWDPAYQLLEPFVIAANGIPRVALAPLIIMWLGIGLTPKLAIAALMVFFIVFMNSVTGIRHVSRQLIQIARIMGGSRSAILRKVVIPAAAPFILTALRLTVPMAVIGAIIGEFISSARGLGYLINQSTNSYDTAGAFAGVLFLLVMVLVLNFGISVLERSFDRWGSRRREGT